MTPGEVNNLLVLLLLGGLGVHSDGVTHLFKHLDDRLQLTSVFLLISGQAALLIDRCLGNGTNKKPMFYE